MNISKLNIMNISKQHPIYNKDSIITLLHRVSAGIFLSEIYKIGATTQ